MPIRQTAHSATRTVIYHIQRIIITRRRAAFPAPCFDVGLSYNDRLKNLQAHGRCLRSIDPGHVFLGRRDEHDWLNIFPMGRYYERGGLSGGEHCYPCL